MRAMSTVRLIVFALLLAIPGCKAAELASDAAVAPDGTAAPDGNVVPDAGADADAGTPVVAGCTAISESARQGCRGSDDPGCGSCCLQTSAASCTKWSIPCTMSVAGQPVADYCGVFSVDGQCPADCQPCAACSKSSEATICLLMPTIGACDCPHIDIGIDPCIMPQSCACLCRGYLAAQQACPP
jgi:hypothetical protein